MIKYRFEITYQNKWVIQASEFISKLDLGIDGFGIKETATFSSKKDLSIQTIKDTFHKAYESCECKILHIEGGKIE